MVSYTNIYINRIGTIPIQNTIYGAPELPDKASNQYQTIGPLGYTGIIYSLLERKFSPIKLLSQYLMLLEHALNFEDI